MKIITSGKTYIDIDGYASIIVYRELLRALGEDAYAVSSAKPNSSVPPLIQELSYKLDENVLSGDKEYVLLDVSNPDFISSDIGLDEIVEVIDHHTGFEDYWKERHVKAQIEFIGSVCTIVYEKIKDKGMLDILDTDLCKLLIAGILDNTLNLRASITTERDKDAIEDLKRLGGVSYTWDEEYFDACDDEKEKDYKAAILNDLKIESVRTEFPAVFGQIILSYQDRIDFATIASAFAGYGRWLMNVISITDGKSYLYFNGDGVAENLEKLFGVDRKNDHLIVLDEFLLRKQILKKIRETL